jgi:hypothetical protein
MIKTIEFVEKAIQADIMEIPLNVALSGSRFNV